MGQRRGSDGGGPSATPAPSYVSKALAGTGAGVFATVLCSPLDVAKTRIQVQTSAHGQAKYSGILSSLGTILREEGWRGWYLGFEPAVFSVGVFWTVYFPSYDYAKEAIARSTGLSTSSGLVHMSAAASAGLLTDIITNPLWMVRTRLAAQGVRQERPAVKAAAASASASATAAVGAAAERLQYRSMRHAFATIAREEGLLAFFNGLSASILGLSHIMIQFPFYEWIKAELLLRDPATRPQPGGGASAEPAPPSPLSHVIAASGLSKLVASSITYPHEVIRARLQFDRGGEMYTGLVDATRKTIRHDGLMGLWLGFRLNIVRTIPQCVVTFTLYEFFASRIARLLHGAAPSLETASRDVEATRQREAPRREAPAPDRAAPAPPLAPQAAAAEGDAPPRKDGEAPRRETETERLRRTLTKEMG